MCVPKTVRILRTAPAGFYPVCLPAFTGDESGNSNSNSNSNSEKHTATAKKKSKASNAIARAVEFLLLWINHELHFYP